MLSKIHGLNVFKPPTWLHLWLLSVFLIPPSSAALSTEDNASFPFPWPHAVFDYQVLKGHPLWGFNIYLSSTYDVIELNQWNSV